MATHPSTALSAPVPGDVDELDVLRIPPASALPVAAVDRLPRGELGSPELVRTRTGAWSPRSSSNAAARRHGARTSPT
jgi:hypothetical protein